MTNVKKVRVRPLNPINDEGAGSNQEGGELEMVEEQEEIVTASSRRPR